MLNLSIIAKPCEVCNNKNMIKLFFVFLVVLAALAGC